MRFVKFLMATGGLFILVVSWWLPSNATLVRAGEDVAVAEEETITEDLALFGESVRVLGYVESDVIAFGKTITVPGTVNQDLMGGAETVEITGQVGDDVRAGARYLGVHGLVGDDLIGFCQEFILGENGRIGGEAQIWCQKAVFYGDVDGNLRAKCETAEILGHVGGSLSVDACCITLAGPVDGDAELTGETISLLPECMITGNLKYTSGNQIEIQEGAQVLGQTEWQKPEAEVEKPKKRIPGGLRIFLNLTMLVAQFIVGLILIGFSRKNTARMANTLTGHPWMSLGLGFLFMFLVPIAALIMMLTIIGLPLGIIVFLLYLIIWYLGPVLVGLTIGGKMVGAFKKERTGPMVGGLLLGLIILRLLSFIPGFGWLIQFLVILFGMGALILSRKSMWNEAKAKDLV
jgi:cytoskeletal protein CcmA (bactofilin family)